MGAIYLFFKLERASKTPADLIDFWGLTDLKILGIVWFEVRRR